MMTQEGNALHASEGNILRYIDTLVCMGTSVQLGYRMIDGERHYDTVDDFEEVSDDTEKHCVKDDEQVLD